MTKRIKFRRESLSYSIKNLFLQEEKLGTWRRMMDKLLKA
jgi:hypothetical protein